MPGSTEALLNVASVASEVNVGSEERGASEAREQIGANVANGASDHLGRDQNEGGIPTVTAKRDEKRMDSGLVGRLGGKSGTKVANGHGAQCGEMFDISVRWEG